MYLLAELSAQSIINDISKDTNPIERLERNNVLKNSGINNFIKPPKRRKGIVPIKIDLHNFFEKYKRLTSLEYVLYKLKIFFLKYQKIAKILPICKIAEQEEPGSLKPNN